MLYQDLNNALLRARERSGASPSDDEYLKELLYASAGKSKSDDRQTYRPFYVAAKFLEQSRDDQSLSEADGAKFTGMETPIRSLLNLQASLDEGIFVPLGFECFPILDVESTSIPSATQRQDAYKTAKSILFRYRARGGAI